MYLSVPYGNVCTPTKSAYSSTPKNPTTSIIPLNLTFFWVSLMSGVSEEVLDKLLIVPNYTYKTSNLGHASQSRP